MNTGHISLLWLLVLLVSCSSRTASPSLYASYFGFQVQLPADWIALNPRDAAAANAGESVASLQIADFSDPSNLASILDRVKAGEVEFYYDRTTLDEENKNNVSAQLVDNDWGALTDEQARDICSDLSSQLSPVFSNNPVAVHSYGMTRSNGIDYIAMEYSVPASSYHVVQYELPFKNGKRLVIVGGTFESGRPLQRVKEMQNVIAKAATAFVASPAKR